MHCSEWYTRSGRAKQQMWVIELSRRVQEREMLELGKYTERDEFER